jgi:hypothetical protein
MEGGQFSTGVDISAPETIAKCFSVDQGLVLTFRTSRDRYTPPLQLAPAEV